MCSCRVAELGGFQVFKCYMQPKTKKHLGSDREPSKGRLSHALHKAYRFDLLLVLPLLPLLPLQLLLQLVPLLMLLLNLSPKPQALNPESLDTYNHNRRTAIAAIPPRLSAVARPLQVPRESPEKGPCTQKCIHFGLKVLPVISTLGPKYLLFGYMDCQGLLISHGWFVRFRFRFWDCRLKDSCVLKGFCATKPEPNRSNSSG